MGQVVRFGSGIGLLLGVGLSGGVQAGGLSEPTGSVKGRAPVASAVVVSNQTLPGVQPRAGNVLQVSYNFSDPDGDTQNGTTIQWMRGGSAISGATNSTYVVQSVDAAVAVSAQVTPRTSATDTDPDSGTPRVSAALTVAAAGAPVGVDRFQWLGDARTWPQANAYCGSLGARLPIVSELQQLFNTRTSGVKPNSQMCSLYSWPLGSGGCGGATNNYWTSDSAGSSGSNYYRYEVNMMTGNRGGGVVTSQALLVACIK